MDDMRPDPDQPLPGAPDPWASSSMPAMRSGPPYHMTEMIAAEAGLAGRLLARLADPAGPAARFAAEITATAGRGEPIVLTGCGTSEHAAQGAAEILREAMGRAGLATDPGRPIAIQAFELALRPPTTGLVVAISHEGGTGATNHALVAARAAGARTALVTVSDRSPGGALADLVLPTEEMDTSWCHTVGYLSPLLAAVAIAGHLTGSPAAPAQIAAIVAAGAAQEAVAEAIAAALGDAGHVVVVADGADRSAGRELALKLEEAAWLPSAHRDLETFLHGHLPALDEAAGLVLLLADREAGEPRIARARQALAAAREVGARTVGIFVPAADHAIDRDLTASGRLVVPDGSDLPAPIAALVGTATPLQLLTERTARARGTNPDTIRREDPRYRAAATAGAGT